MEQPGDIIGGCYKLIGNLNADGGMGTIWIADDLQVNSKRRVAVKLPLKEYRYDPEMLARFTQEPEFAAQVGGPNVIHTSSWNCLRGRTWQSSSLRKHPAVCS